jgi:hypothetical protein
MHRNARALVPILLAAGFGLLLALAPNARPQATRALQNFESAATFPPLWF